MRPITFPQSNKILGKPVGMTDEECGSLPVYCDGTYCLSLWQLSLKERLSILFHGHIWLWVLSGYTQPPVSLSADKNIFRKA